MIFEELKSLFTNEIIRLEDELSSYKAKQDNYQVLSNIASFLNDVSNIEICRDIINNRLVTNDTEFNLKADFVKIVDLENLIQNMKSDILSFDDLEFERILSNLDISLEKQNEVKKNLQTFKLLQPYISHVDYSDDAVKQMVSDGINGMIAMFESHKKQILNSFINSLKAFYDKYTLELNDITSNIERILNEINDIRSYDRLFDINGPINLFENEEQLNTFLEYLQKSSLDVETQIKISIEISKFNLDYLNRLKEQKNNSVDLIIEANLQTINSQLEPQEKDKIDVIVVENDVNDTLTEEEKTILDRINEIISLHTNYINEDSVDIFEGDFEVESRSLVYYVNNKLDWNVIISDLKKNLLPNIDSRRKECFSVLKYICNCYDKELIQEQRKVLLKDLCSSIDEIKNQQIAVIDEYVSNKDYYDWIVEESKSDMENAISHIKNVGKTLGWLNFGYFLVNKLIKYQADLNAYILNGDISEELVKKLTDEFHNLVDLYKKGRDYEEANDKNDEIETLEETDEISIGNRNLLFFLDEMPEDLSSDLKSELYKTIKDCSNKSIRELWV